MNRENAKKFLSIKEDNEICTLKSGTKLTFARQNIRNVERIEKLTKDELINEWKSLTWMTDVYGCFSINDLQRQTLLEMEMKSRKIPEEPLKEWYGKVLKEHKEEEVKG